MSNFGAFNSVALLSQKHRFTLKLLTSTLKLTLTGPKYPSFILNLKKFIGSRYLPDVQALPLSYVHARLE